MKTSRQAEKFDTGRLRVVNNRQQQLQAISKKAAGERQANRSKAAAPEQAGRQAASRQAGKQQAARQAAGGCKHAGNKAKLGNQRKQVSIQAASSSRKALSIKHECSSPRAGRHAAGRQTGRRWEAKSSSNKVGSKHKAASRESSRKAASIQQQSSSPGAERQATGR